MGATRNEMLIWEGKDNKQLTSELSIRRRLDKYLRRALILKGWVSKYKKSDRHLVLLTQPRNSLRLT